jgi:peroxin-12
MKSTPATMAAAATPGPEPQRCSSSSGGNGGGEAVAVQQRRLTYARMAVLGVVVGFKALEWWHRAGRAATEEAERAARAEEDEAESEAGEGQRRRRVRPIPPPPAPPPFPAGAVPLPLESGLCPLCLQPRANAAASPGGVTFCYRCLAQYVAEHKQCPVTWVPCKPSGIRRLFDQ